MNGTTIQDFMARCKAYVGAFLGEWGMILILILTALAAFGLGRLSALEGAREPIAIRKAQMQQGLPAMPAGGQLVAARSGTAYYYPWCAGAQKIAQGNQVWFSTEEAAQKAGYRAAKNCKGLATQ